MRPPASDLRFTYDDYVQFPDDGKRHELIDGDHFVTHPLGQVFAAPFDVVFSALDVVEPDLLFVSAARQADILTSAHVRGAPDLVVEVGSPSTRQRDETIKRRLYERFGVAEYWVVDPEIDEVKVYRLADGQFVRVSLLALEAGDTLRSPLFPGLDLSLSEIFAE